MNVNLALPYATKPSSPRSPDLSFYAPGYDDFLFPAGTTPRIVCLPYLRALSLEWTLSHNMVKTPMSSGRLAPRFDNSFLIEAPESQLAPGFYDLRVKAHLTDTCFLEGVTTFGWRIDEMPVLPRRPANFDAFWQAALKKLDAIPAEPEWVHAFTLRGEEIDAYNLASACLPENYDPEGNQFEVVEVYRMRVASYAGKIVEGWYAKPEGLGPFPTVLVLPGAGNNPRPAPVEHARHGYAALDIQVHGFPVDAKEYPNPPADGTDGPESLNHFGLYLNALQAARALRRLPGADPEKIAVLGGSQGGRLTFVVAALDPAVKAAVAAITHYAYLPWLHWTERMNANGFSGAEGFSCDALELHEPERADSYLDVINFAPLVRASVLMNSGLIDAVSPATGVFAAYRLLPGRKEIIPLPNTGHDWSPAFDRYAWRWLGDHMKL